MRSNTNERLSIASLDGEVLHDGSMVSPGQQKIIEKEVQKKAIDSYRDECCGSYGTNTSEKQVELFEILDN
ncbi:MAG: hypothetical protein EZS28_022531 [Streblomastix strix]|uniref:Uncharacterized protein n=1 Tax=Streblomastix strix TaxID=222440 RepID=A0A5J4VHC6_9EUKA|nr:MAG: hypothetical protein EZS28_022531 [Streblomastix strix]